MRKDPNLALLAAVAERLGGLCDEVVFLGGCATGLLITDPAAPTVRPTRDVDVLVELVSKADWYALAERLRERGFREDDEDGAPICRWDCGGLKLDVMPTDAAILGFGNRWYPLAISRAQLAMLPSERAIRHVDAPCFVATKLEAFRGRGAGDYLLSHDIEDLVAVLDGRPELVQEIAVSPVALRQALAEEADGLLRSAFFLEALQGHLPPDEASQARGRLVRERLKRIAGLSHPE